MDNKKRFSSFSTTILTLVSMVSLTTLTAQVAPPLGTAQNFAVLGASTVTNTGPTVLTGDLGVSPGSAVTGFPPGTLTGTIHAADSIAATAQLDAHTAYNFLAAEACTSNLSGTNLGGLTLSPGVYCFNSSAQLTGTLTLNATGSINPIFVFKIGSTFTTDTNANVVIIGGSPCNVYYQVGSSATLGTGTHLLGSIFAQASITSTTGATVIGGSYALSGAVTLDSGAGTACMGTIKICKVAGSSALAGVNFDFAISGTPVTLVTVQAALAPAVSCSPALAVPAQPLTITETLPPIGGPANIGLAQVSTQPSPALLISSNLGAGTATVAVNPGGNTVATFTNAVNPTTGTLQVCKIGGTGVPAGTPFTFNIAGTPVTVLAGGPCSTPLVVAAGPATITETLPAGTTLTSVTTLPIGALASTNLATGTANVTVTVGALTTATFTNTVNPTTGTLLVCKVAGAGVALGTIFTFNVAGTPVNVAAGACSTPVALTAGPAVITETLTAGTTLTSVITLPSAALVSSNLATGTATVTVTAGAQTTATFTNAASTLVVCKVGGTGVPAGTNFTFNVAGTQVIVAAGACSTPMVAPAGPAVITETLPAGTSLTSVTVAPAGALVTSNLAAGTATVTVSVGAQTTATFTNAVIPTTGTLVVCKTAGSGIAVGTVFSFNVAGTVVPVAAGSCSTALVVTAGPATITETLPAGTSLTSVAVLPAGALVSSNLAAGTAVVTVTVGALTTATFTNVLNPTTGTLVVCKTAGSGIAAGTVFSFNVAGTVVPVAAGSCSTALAVTAGPAAITENLLAGTSLTSVAVSPAGALVSSNLAAGTAIVTVAVGALTTATFTNVLNPTTGTLVVCKVAGSGVPAGTNFTFNIAGTAVTIAAGTCATPRVLTAGAAVVTETLPSGASLASVVSTPAGSLVSTNLAGGTATVSVAVGVQTTVNFTNVLNPTTGTLVVCKVGGTGVLAGTNYSFNVAGTAVTVGAGACSTPLVVTAGAATITETLTTGGTLTSVTTSPAGLLVSTNLAAGNAVVTVNAGAQTTATFTNTALLGTLQVCKAAGAGVFIGANYTFNAGGNLFSIPAGAGPGGNCSQSFQFPVGTSVMIAETPSLGTVVSSINVTPVANQGVTSLTGGTVAVTIGIGATNVVFTNTAGGFGLLKVCKIAGAGVAVGTNFTFVRPGGITFTVPAGYCVSQGLFPVGTAISVTELFSATTVNTAISVSPPAQQGVVDLPNRTAAATIGVGVTEVNFTNAVR